MIGASADPSGIGHRVFANVIQGGYHGAAIPVNLRKVPVLDHAAYESVLDIPGRVDLAIVCVPAAAVLDVVAECGKKKVPGLVIISAGFAETGKEGAEREAKLRDLLARYHMRMVGPNCMGIINGSREVRLNATFAATPVRPGSTALMTQSGALGVALLEHANDLHLGIARFASMGNKTDVSSNDLLMLWEDDPEVGAILMYLENFGNPRNFVRIARRVGRKKPILVVKSGRSALGAKAASSHTGALAQGERLVDALLNQCGVLRLNTVEQLMDCALGFALQPLPKGDRVGIVTNSGGPAIMAIDALEAAGLRAATFSSGTLSAVAPILPKEAALANPLDLLAGGGPTEFNAAIRATLRDPGVDALIVICTPIVADDEPLANAIADAAESSSGKPVMAVFFGQGSQGRGFIRLVESGIPTYTFPESAVFVLGAMRRIVEFRTRPAGKARAIRPLARKATEALREPTSGAGWLSQEAALQLLDAYGIPTVPHMVSTTAAHAARAAKKIGFPVVLKIESKTIVHKSEVGGIKLNLTTPTAVRDAFRELQRRAVHAGHKLEGVLVMRQAKTGRELLIGATRDPKFGPLIALGLGGIYAEVLKDVVFRLAPITDEDAKDMIANLRSKALLQGVRGEPPSDTSKLIEVLQRVSRLVTDHREILELDINPFFLYPKRGGGVAVDARVRLQKPDG